MSGVCSGLTAHLGVSIALMRTIAAYLSVVGIDIGVYLWLWVNTLEGNPERTDNGALSPGFVRPREERVS